MNESQLWKKYEAKKVAFIKKALEGKKPPRRGQGGDEHKRRRLSISTDKVPKSVASTMYYLQSEEITAILSVLAEDKKLLLAEYSNSENRQDKRKRTSLGSRMRRFKQDHLMILMGLDLGTRVGEIITLPWEDVDFQNRVIKIWDEKKDRLRICVMSEPTWIELIEYQKEVDLRRERWVFPVSAKTANRLIKNYAARAGIKRRVRWHTLRHTHVVQGRRVGRDWDELSQQTGDDVRSLITHYSRLSIEDRRILANEKPLI